MSLHLWTCPHCAAVWSGPDLVAGRFAPAVVPEARAHKLGLMEDRAAREEDLHRPGDPPSADLPGGHRAKEPGALAERQRRGASEMAALRLKLLRLLGTKGPQISAALMKFFEIHQGTFDRLIGCDWFERDIDRKWRPTAAGQAVLNEEKGQG